MLKTPLPKWQKTASETLNSLGFIQKKDTLTLPNLNSGFTIGKKNIRQPTTKEHLAPRIIGGAPM